MRDYENYFINKVRTYFDPLFDGIAHERDLVHEELLKKRIAQQYENGTLSLETAAGLCEDIDSFGKFFDDQVKYLTHLNHIEKTLSIEDL